MVYSPEEKQRMDAVFHAFHDYIAGHRYYDLLYSEKAGYLRVSTGESCDEIYFSVNGLEHMIQMFVDDYLLDEESRAKSNLRMDYDRVRAQLIPIFSTLGPDSDLAMQVMEQQIEAQKRRSEHFRQERLKMIKKFEGMLAELRESVII